MPTLRLIGLPALLLADAPILPLERKDAALLAVLALDGPTARDALAALLWPEVPLKTANTSLRQRVFRLRKRSGHDLVDTGERVALQADINLEAALKQADAVDLPSGDLLGSFSYSDCGPLADWVQRQREHWRARRRDARTLAAARHEAQGELARAIEITQQLVAEEPLSEHAQRRLMRLHYLRGDRAAAVQAFEAFERVLKDELNTRPDRETVELLHTIEHAQPAAITRRAVVPASLRRPPRLVGREAELNALDHAWAAGRVFVLLGEAGLGKTRLLQEFATSQGRAVWVQARPGDGAVPFALLARLLRAVHEAAGDAAMPDDVGTRRELARVMPELGTGVIIAGEGQRLVLQRAIESLLHQASERGVSALLADDLHFADAASLEMLQGLIASERLGVLHWGLAQRPGEGGSACEALMRALEETQRLQRVTLQLLNGAQIQALIESLNLAEIDAARWAAPLVRHTGGNPLFALETLKDMVLSGVTHAATAGALPQPVTVGTLIERRLRQLSAPAIALARVAAIAGVDFSIELAEHVLKTPALALADAWAELEGAQVLVGAAFAHDLVSDAVRRSVPAEIARHAHAGVAEWLDKRASDPARLGEHWRIAGHARRAAESFVRAADRARLACRRDDEARLYAAAEACFRDVADHDAAFDARCRKLDALRLAAPPEAARAEAASLLDDAQNDTQRLQARLCLAALSMHLADAKTAGEHACVAADLADQLQHDAARFEAGGLLAEALAAMGDLGEARHALDRVSAYADVARDARARFRFYSLRGYVQNSTGITRGALLSLSTALAAAREVGDLADVHTMLMNLAMVQLSLGQATAASTFAREACEVSTTMGSPAGLRQIDQLNLGMTLLASCQYMQALDMLQQAAEVEAPGGDTWGQHARTMLALAWIRLGQANRAMPLLTELDERHPPIMRALRELVRLDLPNSRTETNIPTALVDVAAQSGNRLVIGAIDLRAARARGADALAQAARKIVEHARAVDMPVLNAAAHVDLADALGRMGDGEAGALAERALTLIEPLEFMWLHKHALLLRLADCMELTGRRELAVEVLVAAARDLRAVAETSVPASLREAFLRRQPVHRTIIERARRPRSQ